MGTLRRSRYATPGQLGELKLAKDFRAYKCAAGCDNIDRCRKIVFMMSVSLDDFFEGPNGERDWQLVDDELHRHFNDWLGKEFRVDAEQVFS